MYFQTGPGWKIQTMSGYGTCAEKILNIMFVKGKNVIILNMLSIFSYKQQEGIQMYDFLLLRERQPVADIPHSDYSV